MSASAKPVMFGSVCSGIEAASVAWGPLGWCVAWLAEIDAFTSAVLKHHYPDVPNLGDMTRIAAQVRAGTVPAPDVLVGGTPCQAYSVAGLRQSLDDPRGQLTLSFVDLANAIDTARHVRGEPAAIIVWENVPGVFSTSDNAFGCFLAGLAGEDGPVVAPGGKWSNAGCVVGPQRTVAWRTFDAQYFGVAQRRRRVFVVASARPGFNPAAVLFEQQGVRRDTAPRREAWQDAAVGTLRSTDGGCDVDHARAGHLQLSVVSTLDASYGRLQGCSGQDANHGHSHLIPLAFGGNNQAGLAVSAYAFQPRIARNGRGDMGEVVNALTAQAGETGKGDAAPCVAITFDSRQDCVSSTAIFGALGSSSPQAQAVAYAIQAGATRTNPASGPDGIGVQRDIAYTIEARAEVQAVCFNQASQHGVGVLVFDTTQITSPANVSNPQPGDPCHPLAAGAHPPAVCIHADAVGRTGDALTPSADAEGRVRIRNPGLGVIEDGTTYNLMATGQPHAVCVTGDIAHTLRADGFDASEDGTGRGQPIVAAFQESQSGARIVDTHATLGANNGPRRMNGAMVGMAVRRLTPRECERLQAFPDDYTLIPIRKVSAVRAAALQAKGDAVIAIDHQWWQLAVDGPRYKALGNSMCVFNMQWIGARIAAALDAEASAPQTMLLAEVA